MMDSEDKMYCFIWCGLFLAVEHIAMFIMLYHFK